VLVVTLGYEYRSTPITRKMTAELGTTAVVIVAKASDKRSRSRS